MSQHDLLLWLSARREGSWSQFRAAVEEIHIQRLAGLPGDPAGEGSTSDLPVYHEVRLGLQRLAHVEFHPRLAWRVVPPSVALLPNKELGFLCGARSTALLEQLNSVVQVEMESFEGGPARVLIRGSGTAIATCARELGLHVQESAPITLLSVIPGVRDMSLWPVEEVPRTPGWTVQRFVPSAMEWSAMPQPELTSQRTALFRFALKHQRLYYLRWRGRSYRVPVQVGKFAVMGKRQAKIAYESDRRAFSVPAIVRPPLLIERALILCSGVLPRFDSASGRLEYGDVPRDVAQLALQLLRQEI